MSYRSSHSTVTLKTDCNTSATTVRMRGKADPIDVWYTSFSPAPRCSCDYTKLGTVTAPGCPASVPSGSMGVWAEVTVTIYLHATGVATKQSSMGQCHYGWTPTSVENTCTGVRYELCLA